MSIPRTQQFNNQDTGPLKLPVHVKKALHVACVASPGAGCLPYPGVNRWRTLHVCLPVQALYRRACAYRAQGLTSQALDDCRSGLGLIGQIGAGGGGDRKGGAVGAQGPGAELQQLLSQLLLSEADSGRSGGIDFAAGAGEGRQQGNGGGVQAAEMPTTDCGHCDRSACDGSAAALAERLQQPVAATASNSCATPATPPGVSAALQQLVGRRSAGLLHASSRPEAGRCLEAAAALAAGTDVLTEVPVAFVVAKRHRGVRCGMCGRSVDAGAALSCAGCPLVSKGGQCWAEHGRGRGSGVGQEMAAEGRQSWACDGWGREAKLDRGQLGRRGHRVRQKGTG